jgi:hypothetical protein
VIQTIDAEMFYGTTHAGKFVETIR